MVIKTAVRTLPRKTIKYRFSRGGTLITKVMTGSIPKIKTLKILIKTAVRTLPSKTIKYRFTRGGTLITKVMTGSIPKIKTSKCW